MFCVRLDADAEGKIIAFLNVQFLDILCADGSFVEVNTFLRDHQRLDAPQKLDRLLEVHIFMSRKKKFNTKYSPEFKIAVIMDMRENHLSYRETARKYNIGSNESQGKDRLRGWERIYLEEGAAGLMAERRGRKSTGRARKQPLNKSMEEDLIAENQRLKERIEYLEAENEYIKKLSALVYAEEQKSGKKRK